MEEIVVKEILKECSWREKIFVRMFTKIFIKVYKVGITFGVNSK